MSISKDLRNIILLILAFVVAIILMKFIFVVGGLLIFALVVYLVYIVLKGAF